MSSSSFRKVIRITAIALCIIAILITGFIRDALFTGINESIASNGSDDFKFLNFFNSIEDAINIESIYIAKWGYTLLFSLIYLVMASSLIYLIYERMVFIYFTIGLYFLLMLISLVILVTGITIDDYAMGYSIARKIMGMVQSPILIMILIPSFRLGQLVETRT